MRTLILLVSLAVGGAEYHQVRSERDIAEQRVASLTETHRASLAALIEQRGMAEEAFRFSAAFFRTKSEPATDDELRAGWRLFYRDYQGSTSALVQVESEVISQ